MKNILIFTCMLLFLQNILIADLHEDLQKADELHKAFKYTEEKEFLLKAENNAKTSEQKAEIYWRLARVTLELGDKAEDEGAEKKNILAIFDKGEEYAEKAIQEDPDNYVAYFWKSANIGRWGQVKGILDSLFKADPMKKLLTKAIKINPEHADSFYVLGELYDELPGFPISFGNMDYAVSFGRLSVHLNQKQVKEGSIERKYYNYYIKLAKHLHKRNWSEKKRAKNQAGKKNKYNKAKPGLKKYARFEGTLNIKAISDREEAKDIINITISELKAVENPTKTNEDDLKDAIDLEASW